MTKVAFHTGFPIIDRDDFLTPFDRMFDQIVSRQFPDIEKSVGVKPFQGTSYPKVNVYEYDDKVAIIAGDKHALYNNEGAKVVRRELKSSSFKRQFELGELLDGDNIKASFKDGLLTIDIPKVEPTQPKKLSVKIG